MPKLKLRGKALYEKLKGRVADSTPLPWEVFADGDSLVRPDATREQLQDGNHQLSLLQRSKIIQRTPSFSPWLCGDFFLCVSVKEACDLAPAVPMRPATCDSFVRVTLQRPVSGALPLEEAETRVITRNSFPMWEECLPFPLDHVTEDTSLILRVLDKDIGHFNSFLGTVSLSMQEVLSHIRKVDHEVVYRMPLQDRHNQTRKRGELLFGVAVVAKHEYKEMRGVISTMQDPDTVHDSLRDYCLHLKLHSLKELSGLSTGMVSSLVIEVSVCSYVVRKPMVGLLVGGELDPEAVEVAVPLGPAFQDGDTLKGKQRAQFGEVKVELLAGRTRLAKTQVPIWDVPVRAESGGAEADSDSDGEVERLIPQMRSTTGSASSPSAARSPDSSTRGGGGAMSHARASELAMAATAAAARRHSDCGAGRASPSRALPNAKDDLQAQQHQSPQQPAAPAATAATAGPRPKWDGKRYCRRMERTDRCLSRPPVAVLSMQLVKTEPGESYDIDTLTTISASSLASGAVGTGGGGGGCEVFDGADVDSPAELLAVPPLEAGLAVADFVVGVGPLALLKSCFGDGAELAQRIWSAEKLTELKVAPWGPDPDGKALCARNLSFMKPSVVGPVAVQSQQKVVVKHGGGFVLHQHVVPSVPPVGPCVKVFTQVVGQHAGPNKTRFTAAVKLEWFKSGMMVNMVKGKVEEGTPKDTRKFFDTMKTELAAKYAVENLAAANLAAAVSGSAVVAASAAATAVNPAAGVSAVAPSAHGAGGRSLLPFPVSSEVLLGLGALSAGTLVLMLLTLFMLLGMARQVRDEVGRCQTALQGLAAAVEVLTGQLAEARTATTTAAAAVMCDSAGAVTGAV